MFVYQLTKDSNYDTVIDLLESMEQSINRLNTCMSNSQTGDVTEVIEKVMMEMLSILALVTKRMKQKRLSKSDLSDIPHLTGRNSVTVLKKLARSKSVTSNEYSTLLSTQ